MGNLLNIAQKRRLAILNEVPAIMHLSYTSTTSLNFIVQTASGDDWEIDWGDGVWERYISSLNYRTKTFSSSTSGVARVRSATGRGLRDISRVQSTEGTWSFDATALSGLTSLTYLYLNGTGFTGNMAGVSGLTSLTYLYLNGTGFTGNMAGVSGLTLLTRLYLIGTGFTGNMAGVSSLTSLNYLYLQADGFTGDMTGVSGLNSLNVLRLYGDGFTLTYSTFTANLETLFFRLQTGELSNPVDIDQLFIDLDAVATTKTGSFDLRSQGAAAPTAASSAARTSLVSKGRTILTN